MSATSNPPPQTQGAAPIVPPVRATPPPGEESIQVGYKFLATAPFYGDVYHKFFVYNDKEGNAWTVGAFTEKNPETTVSGIVMDNLDYGNISVHGGSNTEVIPYDKNWSDHPDHPQNSGGQRPIYYETVLEGKDLSQNWQQVRDVTGSIDIADCAYAARSNNSNTVVDHTLKAMGLEYPELNKTLTAPASEKEVRQCRIPPENVNFIAEQRYFEESKAGVITLNSAGKVHDTNFSKVNGFDMYTNEAGSLRGNFNKETGAFDIFERNDKNQLEKITSVEEGQKFFNIEEKVQQQNQPTQDQTLSKGVGAER